MERLPPDPGFGTLAVHAGTGPDAATGAVTPPIHATSTYVQPELGRSLGWAYSRGENPTREALEAGLAALEGGRHALAFSSGMAAMDAVLRTLVTGDHVVGSEALYGGTIRLLRDLLPRAGIAFTLVDARDPGRVREAMGARTRVVLVESPSNPMLHLTDLEATAEVAHGGGARFVVDNTFATPCFQRPLALGADAVVHSTSKYLSGHSDVIGGAFVTDDDALAEAVRFVRNAAGAVPGPFDAWLTLRGLRTLHLRMRAHDENATAVAQLLEGHPAVVRVFHPGLPSHPQHALARRQMSGFGGVVTVDLGTEARVRDVTGRLRLFALAESLGGVESLVAVPARMSHATLAPEARAALGITEGIVRLSVGVESKEDLLADLQAALAEG